MLVLRGVHHSVSQVLKAQPPAWVGERGIVSLQASAGGGGWGVQEELGKEGGQGRGAKGITLRRTRPSALEATSWEVFPMPPCSSFCLGLDPKPQSFLVSRALWPLLGGGGATQPCASASLGR